MNIRAVNARVLFAEYAFLHRPPASRAPDRRRAGRDHVHGRDRHHHGRSRLGARPGGGGAGESVLLGLRDLRHGRDHGARSGDRPGGGCEGRRRGRTRISARIPARRPAHDSHLGGARLCRPGAARARAGGRRRSFGRFVRAALHPGGLSVPRIQRPATDASGNGARAPDRVDDDHREPRQHPSQLDADLRPARCPCPRRRWRRVGDQCRAVADGHRVVRHLLASLPLVPAAAARGHLRVRAPRTDARARRADRDPVPARVRDLSPWSGCSWGRSGRRRSRPTRSR